MEKKSDREMIPSLGMESRQAKRGSWTFAKRTGCSLVFKSFRNGKGCPAAGRTANLPTGTFVKVRFDLDLFSTTSVFDGGFCRTERRYLYIDRFLENVFDSFEA